LLALGLLAAALVPLDAAEADNPSSVPSVVVPLDPQRILDTRQAIGIATTTPVAAEQTITLQVTGVGGVPAGASGVLLNVTVNGAAGSGYVTAYPSGGARPTASVINYSAGEDVANMITATLGAGGAIDLYNAQASAHLIADVAGYLVAGSGGGTVGPQGPQGLQGPQGPAGPSERPGIGFGEVLPVPLIGNNDLALGVLDTVTLTLRCSATGGGTGSLRLSMAGAPGTVSVNGVRTDTGSPADTSELFGFGVGGAATLGLSSTSWTHYSATVETPAGFAQLELTVRMIVSPPQCVLDGSIDPL
jgi:hypothetical protein